MLWSYFFIFFFFIFILFYFIFFVGTLRYSCLCTGLRWMDGWLLTCVDGMVDLCSHPISAVRKYEL